MGNNRKNDMPKPQAPAAQAQEPELKPPAPVAEKPPEVKPPAPAAKEEEPQGIEVRASRSGFWGGYRKESGDVFTVPNMEKVGGWMVCTDPKVEELHQKQMNELKAQRAVR
jgi:type IV secretory pathway VirB10-like protein